MSGRRTKPKRTKAPKPGKSWRVLAHSPAGDANQMHDAGQFDELVVDQWIHIEQMNDRDYWMQLGPLRVWVTLKPNGDTNISIERDYPAAGKVEIRGSDVDTKGERREGDPWWRVKERTILDGGAKR